MCRNNSSTCLSSFRVVTVDQPMAAVSTVTVLEVIVVVVIVLPTSCCYRFLSPACSDLQSSQCTLYNRTMRDTSFKCFSCYLFCVSIFLLHSLTSPLIESHIKRLLFDKGKSNHIKISLLSPALLWFPVMTLFSHSLHIVSGV